MLTQTRLKELVLYIPETGVFTLVARPRIKGGKPAGHIRKDGYRAVGTDGVTYLAHRLAFLFMTGVWPVDLVDHISGRKDDNRWCNLRESNHTLNAQNTRYATSASSTGYLGVNINGKRFQAKISVNGVRRNLGTFDTPAEAHKAYLNAKRSLHSGSTL